jgi:hypothetical protein
MIAARANGLERASLGLKAVNWAAWAGILMAESAVVVRCIARSFL